MIHHQAAVYDARVATAGRWDATLKDHELRMHLAIIDLWEVAEVPRALWRAVEDRIDAVRDAKAYLTQRSVERMRDSPALCMTCGRTVEDGRSR